MIEKGYYKVKFYNHKEIKVMFFNGENFEGFKSDTFIHDEIERFEPLSDDAVLGDDFVYMAVEWLNNKLVIDGSKVFKDKIKCIEYIQNVPKIDGLEWTIAKLEIVA